MSTTYRVQQDGKTYDSFTAGQIRALARNGKLRRDALIATANSDHFVEAIHVQGLFSDSGSGEKPRQDSSIHMADVDDAIPSDARTMPQAVWKRAARWWWLRLSSEVFPSILKCIEHLGRLSVWAIAWLRNQLMNRRMKKMQEGSSDIYSAGRRRFFDKRRNQVWACAAVCIPILVVGTFVAVRAKENQPRDSHGPVIDNQLVNPVASTHSAVGRGNPILGKSGKTIGTFSGIEPSTAFSPDGLLGLRSFVITVLGPTRPGDQQGSRYLEGRGVTKSGIHNLVAAEVAAAGIEVLPIEKLKSMPTPAILLVSIPMERASDTGIFVFDVKIDVYRPVYIRGNRDKPTWAIVYSTHSVIGSTNPYDVGTTLETALRNRTATFLEQLHRIGKQFVGETSGGRTSKRLPLPDALPFGDQIPRNSAGGLLVVEEMAGDAKNVAYLEQIGITKHRVEQAANMILAKSGLQPTTPEQLQELPHTERPPTLLVNVVAQRMGQLDAICYSLRTELLEIVELSNSPGTFVIAKTFITPPGVGSAPAPMAQRLVDRAFAGHFGLFVDWMRNTD